MISEAIEDCDGYRKLLAAVERDEARGSHHNYRAKLAWVLARAQQYAEKTGIPAADILNAWERQRDYWYMNYYQEAEQPAITGDRVRVFATSDELRAAIGTAGFRCPACRGVSKDAYVCDTGLAMPGSTKTCDWKVFGLLRDLGQGVYVFVKEKVRGQLIFFPVAWEVETTEKKPDPARLTSWPDAAPSGVWEYRDRHGVISIGTFKPGKGRGCTFEGAQTHRRRSFVEGEYFTPATEQEKP